MKKHYFYVFLFVFTFIKTPMNKYFVLLIVAVMHIGIVAAQDKSAGLVAISGQVVDSLTNEAVPYATVGVSSTQAPTIFIKAVACDGDGKFEIELKDAGSYLMTIQSVGTVTLVKPFSLTGSEKKLNLGKITLREKVQSIDEVTVTAQKPLVKVEIDKLIYSMEDDPESKVNNTLEMLRKVPLVTVDGEDKIQLKGSSNFKIYLNGKPSNMLNGQNVSDVLKSMPANSVKNIEVITDPGARYDAEGVGGIINIITARNAFQGYQGSVSANAGSYGSFGAGTYLTAKVGKLGVTGNFNYNNYRRPWGENEGTNTNLINNDYYREMSTGRNKSKGTYLFGHLEASYEIDTLNLLSLGVDLWNGDSKNISERSIAMFNNLDALMYEYNRDGEGRYNYGSTGINFDYQRSTHKKGELFTFSYRFNNSPDGSEDHSYVGNITGEPPTYLRLNQWNDNNAKTREHTGQFDYTNPINKNHSVEGGLKYILRQNLSNVEQYEMAPGTNEWTLLPQKANNDFDHTSHIYAGYVGYAFKTEKIGVRTGVRAEGTQQEVSYRLNEAMNFSTDYFNVVPNITFSYQIKPTQQVRLGYNLRIYRPGIWYLNPYVNDTDPYNISYGNPDLDAEKSNNINFNYSYFSPKITLNINASYTYVNNSIESYTFILPEDPNVKQRTYANIGKNQRVGMYVNAGWTPNKTLRFNLNGGLNYTDVKSEELNSANNGLNGNIYMTAQVTLPKDFRINVNGMYYSGWVMLQGKQSSQYFTSIALNKDFLKKKMTVSLSCSNPFQKMMTYKYSMSDDYFTMNSINRYRNREVRLNLSYRFGTMKEAIKKVQRGISNDDVKGGGGGSEGGGGGGGM